ncbi:hypothetical protein KI387_025106, partial [Taxus chinensis]
VASKDDVERIGQRLEEFMQKFSVHMMGNHNSTNQGGSSGQNNRHMSQGGSLSMPKPNTNTLSACNMFPKVEMRKFDGKDPLNWINQMENFFDLHQIPSGQK